MPKTQRSILRLPIVIATDRQARDVAGRHLTTARGLAVLNSPSLNKGTAFTIATKCSFTGCFPSTCVR